MRRGATLGAAPRRPPILLGSSAADSIVIGKRIRGTMKDADTLRQLRKENCDLALELQATREKPGAEASRAAMCEKAARDAWSFARIALRTGRTRAEP